MAAEKIDTSLEDETLINRLSGTLTFSDIASLDNETKSESLTNQSESDVKGDQKFVQKMVANNSTVRFEVIDAKIIEEKGDKHVEYTILVMFTTGFDSMPGKICKRYSDMSALKHELEKARPDLIRDVPFPPKRIVGNFSPGTLASRSRAFEKFLAYVFSVPELRFSKPFVRFLYGGGLLEGYRLMENGLYERASELLVASWKLQSKVVPTKSCQCLMTLVAAVACYHANGNKDQAQLFADLALQSYPDPQRDYDPSNLLEPKWLVALLRLDMNLCRILGRDASKYTSRLVDMKDKGISIDQSESLLELVLHNKSLWLSVVEERTRSS